jgi:hypothetical protein
LEVPVGRAHALVEQADRAAVECLRDADRRAGRVGHGEPADAIDPFAVELERHLARHQQAQRRALAQQRRRDLGDAVDQMLGVVEQHQRAQRAGRRRQHSQRVGRVRQRDQQRGGDRAGDQRRIGQRCELDLRNAVGLAAAPPLEQRLREPGLADAAGTGERDQPFGIEQCGEGAQVVVAAEQDRAVPCGFAPVRRGRRRRAAVDGRREAVASPRNGLDDIGAEQLAQRRDVDMQVAFFDDDAAPDGIEQLVFRDQPPGPLDQCHQQVERAAAQRRRCIVEQQRTLPWPDLDRAETIGGLHAGQVVFHCIDGTQGHAACSTAAGALVGALN